MIIKYAFYKCMDQSANIMLSFVPVRQVDGRSGGGRHCQVRGHPQVKRTSAGLTIVKVSFMGIRSISQSICYGHHLNFVSKKASRFIDAPT